MNTNFILSSALILILGGIGGYIDYSNTNEREERSQIRQTKEKHDTKKLITFFDKHESEILRIDSLYSTILHSGEFAPTVFHTNQDDILSPYLSSLIKMGADSSLIAKAVQDKKTMFSIQKEETLIKTISTKPSYKRFSFLEYSAKDALTYLMENKSWERRTDSIIYNADDILENLQKIITYKYLAICHTTDEITPKVNAETFEPGCKLSVLHIYDFKTGKKLDDRAIFARNKKETISGNQIMGAKYELILELSLQQSGALNKALFNTPFIQK